MIGFNPPERVNFIVRTTISWYSDYFTSIFEDIKKRKIKKHDISSIEKIQCKDTTNIQTNSIEEQENLSINISIKNEPEEKLYNIDPEIEQLTDIQDIPTIKVQKQQQLIVNLETKQLITEFSRIILLTISALVWATVVWWILYSGLFLLIEKILIKFQ